MVKNNLYRREGKIVYIKQPDFNELEFVKALWADIDTMKDVGGVYDFSKSKWELFYKKMVLPTDGKNFYCLIYKKDGEPIGEVSFHGYDIATKIARFNVKIMAKYRRRGYGFEAARLILEYFFYELGGLMMIDTVVNDMASATLTKLGFEIIRKHGEEVTYKITKEKFIGGEASDSRKVYVLVEDETDIISFAPIIDILGMSNRICGKELFDIKILSTSDEDVKLSCGVKIKVDDKLENVKKCNILILPSNKYVHKTLEKPEILEFIRKQNNKAELIVGVDDGMLLLAKSGILENLTIPFNEDLNEEIKSLVKDTVITKNSFFDNGVVLLSSTNTLGIELAIYIVKKFLGEEKVREITKLLSLTR